MNGNPVKRAWRSRGFGIHSPFAFRFITSVLRGCGAYYSYPAIRQLSVNSRDFRDLAIIFRIICDVCPPLILLAAADTESIRATIAYADSRIPVRMACEDIADSSIADKSLLYIYGDNTSAMTAAAKVFDREGIVVARDTTRAYTEAIISILRHGMTFTNGQMTIMVSRHDLPRQDFEISF